MAVPLREFTGKVVEMAPKHKAIVQFQLDNKTERALLWYDKLRVNGEPCPEGGSIDSYLRMNTMLKFLCHTFDVNGVDRCGWYITSAWRQAAEDMDMSTSTVVHGLHNCQGQVSELARRQGVLTYTNNGVDENVMFLASKLFISGKRVQAKVQLNQMQGLEEGRMLYFDAVPCDSENASNCKWFATVVWKGRKPVMEYDKRTRPRVSQKAWKPSVEEVKQIISNPHNLFLRTEGQILNIINEEWGIALATIQPNRFESVLFHRSCATLFDLSLATRNLMEVFKEGDMLRIIAAAAPRRYKLKWIASQIRIYIDPSISHLFQFETR